MYFLNYVYNLLFFLYVDHPSFAFSSPEFSVVFTSRLKHCVCRKALCDNPLIRSHSKLLSFPDTTFLVVLVIPVVLQLFRYFFFSTSTKWAETLLRDFAQHCTPLPHIRYRVSFYFSNGQINEQTATEITC